MAKTKGLPPKHRKLAVKKPDKIVRANQWNNTIQQNKFMEYYLDVSSPSFGNTYQSALRANYSDSYARQMSAIGVKWLSEYKRLSKLRIEHLEQKLIKMIQGVPNSRSPDDTVLSAIELYAKVTGQLDQSNNHTTVVVQPILNGTSTPLKVESTTD